MASLTLRDPGWRGRGGWSEEKIKGREMRQRVGKKGSGGERKDIGMEKEKCIRKGWQEERKRRE